MKLFNYKLFIMKFKFISIFIILLLVSCSGNDSSSADQVFLDQYNGVVWENSIWNQANASEQDKYIVFGNNFSILGVHYSPNKSCSSTGVIKVGDYMADGKITKITNLKDFFSIEVKLDNGAVTTDSWTVKANGTILEYKYEDGLDTYSYNYIKTNIPNPCN